MTFPSLYLAINMWHNDNINCIVLEFVFNGISPRNKSTSASITKDPVESSTQQVAIRVPIICNIVTTLSAKKMYFICNKGTLEAALL